MSYLTTYTGKHFHFDDIESNVVDIVDIAWALSHACRFNGHCRQFYSVTQHSYHVAWLVSEEHRLQALLHDAAEAYTGDMVRPLKKFLPEYIALQKRVDRHIFRTFGVAEELHSEVKRADNVMLATEMLRFMPDIDVDLPAPASFSVEGWSPEDARKSFLELFWQLTP